MRAVQDNPALNLKAKQATEMGREREGARRTCVGWPSQLSASSENYSGEDKGQERKPIKKIAEREQSFQGLLFVTRLKTELSLHHGY